MTIEVTTISSKTLRVFFLLERSVKVVPLTSETDTFVYAKLDTPMQKVELKINFN